MLLKSADNKSKRMTLLEDLQKSDYLEFHQKKWLREELQRCKKGIQGERESAHYLDSYFKNSDNHVVLHDLRFELNGDIAQIDHLIINRTGQIFLIETKNYSGDLMINEHGEFTVKYDKDVFGIPSPLEQSRRHERILARILNRLEIFGRLNKLPNFHHVVMMHPKAIIKRPDQSLFDTSFLIKCDQFPTWHGKFVDKLSLGTIIKSLFNLRSQETIAEWGSRLKRQHRAPDLLALPEFMHPKAKSPEPSAAAAAIPVYAPALVVLTKTPTAIEAFPEKKLICAHCGSKITYSEGKFCWNKKNRFNGLQYCREHQPLFTEA